MTLCSLGIAGELIECTKFQWAFVSPRVHGLLQEDKTLDSGFIEPDDQGLDEERLFEFLGELGFVVDVGSFDVLAFVGLSAHLHDIWRRQTKKKNEFMTILNSFQKK
jgi:hypothetical protein